MGGFLLFFFYILRVSLLSWDSETRMGLRQKKQQESPGRAAWLTERSEKRGPWRQVQGVSPGGAPAAHGSTGCKAVGTLKL